VLDAESTRPLLFVAIDDGFAPIKGLIEHAMTLGAAEYIHLYWIGSGPEPHYLDNLCRSWLDAFDNFRYTPLAIGERGDTATLQAELRRLGQEHPDLGDCDAFVAGGHAGVEQVGRALLELGLPETRLRREVMGA
jgi:CDP-4-dehydro-6-deoxyglucose reductase